jgi:hypothetical protein
MFDRILNLALWNMLIHVMDNPNCKATDVDYKKVVSHRIADAIRMMMHGLNDVVKRGGCTG